MFRRLERNKMKQRMASAVVQRRSCACKAYSRGRYDAKIAEIVQLFSGASGILVDNWVTRRGQCQQRVLQII